VVDIDKLAVGTLMIWLSDASRASMRLGGWLLMLSCSSLSFWLVSLLKRVRNRLLVFS
jgi:hypothetical protein